MGNVCCRHIIHEDDIEAIEELIETNLEFMESLSDTFEMAEMMESEL